MNTEELIEKLSELITGGKGYPDENNYLKKVIKSFMESEQVAFTSTSKNHYRQIPGLQAWDFAAYMHYDIGTAFCYLWRAGLKGDKKADLKKALDHVEHYRQNKVNPIYLPRDTEHLFRKYFSENTALALVEMNRDIAFSIDKVIKLIQDEINEN